MVSYKRDRFSPQVAALDAKRFAVSYGGSIAIHAFFLALMFVGFEIYPTLSNPREIAIEVTIETLTKAASQAINEDAAKRLLRSGANASAGPNQSFDPRDIADEERQQKAARDSMTIDGNGTENSRSAEQNNTGENRDNEEPKNDPNKEAFRLVRPLPKSSRSQQKERIAPPGQDAKATVKEEPQKEDKETTAKRKPIQCGANAKIAFPNSSSLKRGQVLGQLTKDQADRLIQINQANTDTFLSPGYADNVRVFVHVDGTPEGKWGVVLLPEGLSARTGDRVEFVGVHQDPSRPCHYIPPLVLRLL
jgi:hypothetical protein